jgi:serine/threonine protein kinase
MVTRDGTVKVTDFGIARAAMALADATESNAKGRPAPAPGSSNGGGEAAFATVLPSGMVPSEAADVDALGVLLYQMLTARAPWAGNTPEEVAAARKAGPPARPSSVRPGIPTGLDDIAMKALGPARSRYSSAAGLADAIDEFIEAESSATAPAMPAGVAPDAGSNAKYAPPSRYSRSSTPAGPPVQPPPAGQLPVPPAAPQAGYGTPGATAPG